MSGDPTLLDVLISVGLDADPAMAELVQFFSRVQGEVSRFQSTVSSAPIQGPNVSLAGVEALSRSLRELTAFQERLQTGAGGVFGTDLGHQTQSLLESLGALKQIQATVERIHSTVGPGYTGPELLGALQTRPGAAPQLQYQQDLAAEVRRRAAASGLVVPIEPAGEFGGRGQDTDYASTQRVLARRRQLAEIEVAQAEKAYAKAAQSAETEDEILDAQRRVLRARNQLDLAIRAQADDETKRGRLQGPAAIPPPREDIDAAVAKARASIAGDTPDALRAAELDVTRAYRKYASVEADVFSTTEQRLLAERQLIAAHERLIRVEQKQAAEAQLSAGGRGGRGFFGSAFGGSADGRSDFMDQAGFAFRYYAYYKVFELGADLLQRVRDETVAYANAVTNLTFALGVNEDQAQDTANSLTDVAASLGAPPQVGLQSGTAFIRAFQGQGSASSLGQQGAQIGSQLALLGDPEKVQENIRRVIAITQAFDLGPSGTQTVLDAATIAAQRNGLPSADLVLPGAAQIADLSKESGFTPQQTLAMVAAVVQATGHSSDAAAGELQRVLGRSGNADFQSIFARYGIATNQPLAQEFEALSAKFQQLPEGDRSRIISQVGGGRAGTAGAVLVAQLPQIFATAEQAEGTPGAARDQAQALLSNVGGLFTQINTQVSLLASNLSKSGLLAPIGLMLETVKDILNIVNNLIEAFNKIPGPLRTALTILGEVALAIKLIGAESIASFGAKFLPTLVGGRAAAAAPVALGDALAAGGFAAGGRAAAGAAGAEAAGLAATRASTGLLAMAGSVGVTIAAFAALTAAVYGVSEILAAKDRQDQNFDTLTDADDIANAAIAINTPDALRAAGNRIREAQAGAGEGGWNQVALGIRGIGSWLSGEGFYQPADQYNKANEVADQLLAEADRREKALASNPNNLELLFGVNGSDVGGGISELLRSGASNSRITGTLSGLFKTLNGSDTAALTSLFSPNSTEGVPSLAELIKSATDQAKNEGYIGDTVKQLREIYRVARRGQTLAEEGGDLEQIAQAKDIADDATNEYFSALNDLTKKRIQQIQSLVRDKGKGKKKDADEQIRELVQGPILKELSAGDINSAADLLSGLDEKTMNVIRASIKSMIDSARAALQAAENVYLESQALISAMNILPDDESRRGRAVDNAVEGAAPGQQAKLRNLQTALKNLGKAGKIADLSGSSLPGVSDDSDSGETAQDREIARILAEANPYDRMSQARAQLHAAAVALENDKKGTVEYYNDLKAFKEAQAALSNLVAEHHHDVRSLHIDATNPVRVARLDLREAERELRRDKENGAGSYELTKDRISIRDARNNLEKTKFQQELDDYQTNYDLNRISYQAYVRYLQSQHDYLTSIAHRTRQQQEMLNQVDQTMKSLAEEMSGQFNLGDIDVPTPYEARRYIKSQGQYIAGGGDSSSTTIYINGADTGMVQQILVSLLGSGALARTGSAAKRF